MRIRTLAAAAAMLVTLSGAAVAQETGDLMGRITVEGTSSPIGTALVLIEGTGARGTTDDQGRFPEPAEAIPKPRAQSAKPAKLGKRLASRGIIARRGWSVVHADSEETRAQNMAARNVRVLFTHIPIPRDVLEERARDVRVIADRLSREATFPVILQPEEVALPRDLFFDSVYHLTGEGARRRTEILIPALRQHLDPPEG